MKNSKGAVTVIVTLLLIPSILISGTAVDVARIYSAKSIVQDANSLGANAAMAQYNTLLKELYGLYGMQDKKLQSMVNDYISVALFGDENTETGIGTFLPFYGSESSLSISITAEHNLGELEVLQRQIEEYMALRAPVKIADEIMDIIKSLKNVSADSNAIKTKMEIDDELKEVHEIYKKIYQTVTSLDEYPDEEKNLITYTNKNLGKMNTQFNSLLSTRTSYIQLKKDFRATKESLEAQIATLKQQQSEIETEKQNKEKEKQNIQDNLNKTQQTLNDAQNKKAEAEKNAQEENTQEENTQKTQPDGEETEEGEKTEEEIKAEQEKTEEEAKKKQEQLDQMNNDINSMQDQVNQMNNSMNQLNTDIAQKDAQLQTVKDSLEANEKKLTQETKNYELKKEEYEDKYKDIVLNIVALTTGGLVKTSYRSGQKDEEGNYSKGYWYDDRDIISGANGSTVWNENMSLTACRSNANKLVERYEKLVDKLVEQMNAAEKKKANIKAKLNTLKSQLNDCSSELKTGFTEKKEVYDNQSLIEYYEKILEYDLSGMAQTVKSTENGAFEQIKKSIKDMGYGTAADGVLVAGKLTIEILAVLATSAGFRTIEDAENVIDTFDTLRYYAQMDKSDYQFKSTNSFVLFENVNEQTKKFYDTLKQIMDDTGTQLEKQILKSLNQIVTAAKTLVQGVIELPEGADYYPVSIGSVVTSELETGDNWGSTEQAKKSAENALGNPILAQFGTIANDCTNKLLLVTYGTSMFSNYATNKPLADDKKEESLTGYKFEKRMNYFYQSEQEFLFAGRSEAKSNLDAVTGLILIVRFVMDYGTSFGIAGVNEMVGRIGLTLPFPANVIVSELLRFALVLSQAYVDVFKLRMGYRVPLMHTEKTWQFSPSNIDTLGDDIVKLIETCKTENAWKTDDEKKEQNGKGLNYSNYLSIMLLFINKTTLTQRIQLLIELNLTNNKNDTQADWGKMASVERISLSDYVTGIKMDTSVQMDTLFFTMKMFQDGINGVKPSTKYTISDTIYRGY